MVDQKQNTYITTTPMGIQVPVTYMSRDDVERKMAEFEVKYGMSSAEFVHKWNEGALDCAGSRLFQVGGILSHFI